MRAAPGPERGGTPALGIAYLLCAILVFGVLEATAKHLSATYSVPQVMWARFFFHAIFTLALMAPSGVLRCLSTRRFGLHLVRSLLVLTATMSFFFAISYVPLADATSVLYLSPLLVTALSVPMLGERVGARRWVAVAIGFAGVLVIMRPGLGVAHWALSIVLITALSNALFVIITRLLGATEPALTTLLYTALIGMVASSAWAPFFWTAPDLAGWFGFVALGASGGVGHYLLIKALEHATPSSIQPYTYLHILWSAMLGYVIFGNFPDIWTFVGALLIVGGGLFAFYRETASVRVHQKNASGRGPG